MTNNLLLVDDSATTRMVLKRIISMAKLPFECVLEAANGREGLEVMRRNKIDLVLADLNMPEMNGQEMIAEMRADPALCKLPVIVISSEGNPEILAAVSGRGVLSMIRKPFNSAALTAAVKSAMPGE